MLLKPLGRDHLGAKVRHVIPVVGVADGGGDARAGGTSELNRRGADTAGATVDEQPLAQLQTRLGEHAVVGGRERLGDGAGLHPVQVVGDWHQDPLMHDRKLGLAATGDDPHHAIANRKPVRTPAQFGDFARELQSRDFLRRARWRRIEAAALHHVGAVEPRGLDTHEHLAGAGLGVGVVLDAQVAVFDRDRAHACREGN